jgi:flagellar export protein FliJ
MESIAGLAQAEEREAAARLSRSHRELGEVEKKIQELKSCRQEYARHWQAQGGASMDAIQMQSLWVFIRRLDEAIAQLEAQVMTKHEGHEREKHRWLNTRNKARALDDIASRHRMQEERARILREQREVDDRSPGGYGIHDLQGSTNR